MNSPERTRIQNLALFITFPLWGPPIVLGFLWQFINYGWCVGNVTFNRFFERKR